MYVIVIRYLKPLEEIEKHVVAHRAFLEKQYQAGLLLASGPQVPRSGGVILARSLPREKLVKLFGEDPFVAQGVAEYQFIEFQAVKHAAGFEDWLKPAG